MTALAITETDWADFLNNLFCYSETPLHFPIAGATYDDFGHGPSRALFYLLDSLL